MALSSCVLGWDVDQWPGPQQAYTGHQTGWHDVRLVPDLATLRPAAWLDRTAICVADFVEMGRDDLVTVAPRTILRRQIEHVEDAGFTPQVATELEFALYRGTYDDGRDERLRDAAADHARARRLHGAGGRSARGVLRRRPRGVVGIRARTVDQPGGVGARPMGDQPGVPARAGDGRPSHPVQARDARHGRRRGDVGHVHAEAVRRHDRLVMPPAPVAAERERGQRVPRRGGRARRRGHAVAGGRRAPRSARPT